MRQIVRLKRGTVLFASEQTTLHNGPTELHEETYLKELRLLEGDPRSSQGEVSGAPSVELLRCCLE